MILQTSNDGIFSELRRFPPPRETWYRVLFATFRIWRVESSRPGHVTGAAGARGERRGAGASLRARKAARVPLRSRLGLSRAHQRNGIQQVGGWYSWVLRLA
jgi:hypothetical protein